MAKREMRDCPYCRESISAEAVKCRFCASTLEPDVPPHGGVCPYCKEKIHAEATRCRHCHSMLGGRPVPVHVPLPLPPPTAPGGVQYIPEGLNWCKMNCIARHPPRRVKVYDHELIGGRLVLIPKGYVYEYPPELAECLSRCGE